MEHEVDITILDQCARPEKLARANHGVPPTLANPVHSGQGKQHATLAQSGRGQVAGVAGLLRRSGEGPG